MTHPYDPDHPSYDELREAGRGPRRVRLDVDQLQQDAAQDTTRRAFRSYTEPACGCRPYAICPAHARERNRRELPERHYPGE